MAANKVARFDDPNLDRQIVELVRAVNEPKAAPPHDHDDRYFTETELDTPGAGGAVHWDNVTAKPSIFQPESHTHPGTEITSAVSESDAVDGKHADNTPGNLAVLDTDGRVLDTNRVLGILGQFTVAASGLAALFDLATDGDVTISANTQLPGQVMFYNNLTIDSGVRLYGASPYSYLVFVAGTLTLNGTLSVDGAGGAGSNPGSGQARGGNGGGFLVVIARSITGNGVISANGDNGGTTTTTTSQSGAAGSGAKFRFLTSANGGQGSSYTSSAQAQGGAAVDNGGPIWKQVLADFLSLIPNVSTTPDIQPCASGGGASGSCGSTYCHGGGGGSSLFANGGAEGSVQSAAVASAGGGGGGGGGAAFVVCVNPVPGIAIRANGGTGGNGYKYGNGGGGGGGGLVFLAAPGSSATLSAQAGPGGSKGANGGSNGNAGGAGLSIFCNLAA